MRYYSQQQEEIDEVKIKKREPYEDGKTGWRYIIKEVGFASIFIVIGLFTFLYGVSEIITPVLYPSTEGKIVKIREEDALDLESPGSVKEYADVVYEVDGKSYEKTFCPIGHSTVGDSITIYYHPNNPSDSSIVEYNSNGFRFILSILGLVISLVFFGVGVLCIVSTICEIKVNKERVTHQQK